ncbi:MAG: DNA alkylation repair protein [Bacteroidales bacterium]|nr:DNA alkylation repair protein [Bacteroidales bacterium]
MPEQLKHIFFTKESIKNMAEKFHELYPAFSKTKFLDLMLSENFEKKELKEKMYHTTRCLHTCLPEKYTEALPYIRNAAPYIKGFEAMCLPDYVEQYGQDNLDESLEAMAYLTKFSSSEFAIRPFLNRWPEKVMAYMLKLAGDTDEKVRRFASEGCRPRLPWAMALPFFKKDPGLIIPVLEKLNDDPSDFVRRSVANNLNDISKDHPDLVLDICKKWQGKSPQTDEIIKHALRTLLKSGNKKAMLLFGFGDPDTVQIKNLSFDKTEINIGEDLYFTFDILIQTKGPGKIRLEYAVYYIKANGKPSRKIFQIIEKEYNPGAYTLKRKHTFIDMSTRKHYPGMHKFEIYVNGIAKAERSIQLGG